VKLEIDYLDDDDNNSDDDDNDSDDKDEEYKPVTDKKVVKKDEDYNELEGWEQMDIDESEKLKPNNENIAEESIVSPTAPTQKQVQVDSMKIPDTVNANDDLGDYLWKSVASIVSRRLKKQKNNKVTNAISIAKESSSKGGYWKTGSFEIFKKGTISLTNFKSFALTSVKSDIKRNIMQERIVLEYILSVLINYDNRKDQNELLQMDNLSSFLNDLSSTFHKFVEYAINKEEELKKAINFLKFNHTESILNLFTDVRNSRKIFSKLFYGIVRKSIIEFLTTIKLTDNSVFEATMELPLWSKFDCDSFEVDEANFKSNNDISFPAEPCSYPLSVMYDRIWEILNPSVQYLLRGENKANLTYDCLDEKHNCLLFVTSLYMTAKSIYKNQVKRDLIPNYVTLFEVLSEFVQKLLKYKIFVNVDIISDLNFLDLEKYYVSIPPGSDDEENNNQKKKAGENGRGKSYFKSMIEQVVNSTTMFERMQLERIQKRKKLKEDQVKKEERLVELQKEEEKVKEYIAQRAEMKRRALVAAKIKEKVSNDIIENLMIVKNIGSLPVDQKKEKPVDDEKEEEEEEPTEEPVDDKEQEEIVDGDEEPVCDNNHGDNNSITEPKV